jgi:hypothetical protein
MRPTNTAWVWIEFRIPQYIIYSMHNVSEVCRVSWKYFSSDSAYKQFVLTHVRKFVSMAFWKQVRREFKFSWLWLRELLSWGVWRRVVWWKVYRCFGSKFCLKIQVSTYYTEACRICLLLRRNNKCWCSHSCSVATVGKIWVVIKYKQQAKICRRQTVIQ